MSARDEAAVGIVMAMGERDVWTRAEVYAFAHANGGSRATFDALARAGERGWVDHVSADVDGPECWVLTDNGRRRASR